MKRNISIFTLNALIAGVIFTGCNTPDHRMEMANKNIITTEKALDEANEAFRKDRTSYRTDMLTKIAAYNVRIIDLKEKMQGQKGNNKTVYEVRITDLQQRNNALKKVIEEYKPEGKYEWEIFKTEFNHDIDELGKAFKNVPIKNIQ
jgi:hypothetical protein